MFSYSSQTRLSRPPMPIVFACVVVIMSLSLLVTACGGGANGNTPVSSATSGIAGDLITPGVLTVGSDLTYPPQEFTSPPNNQPVGFDIDLITAVAQHMGLKVAIVNAAFKTIIDSLAAKRFDVVISAVTVSPERAKKVDSVSYFSAGESLLVRQGNPKNIHGVTDLCGLDVGVQDGTVEQTDLQTASTVCQKAGKPDIKVTVLQDQTAVVQLLATNRVVATYQDSPVTDYYLKQNPGRFTVGGSVVNAAVEGILVRKGDTTMLNGVQTAFSALKANGTYRSLIQKWGLNSGAIAVADRRTFYV